MDLTAKTQHIAAAASVRAAGQRMTFVPGGDDAQAFDVRGQYNPKPIIKLPDGSWVITETPTVWIPVRALDRLGREPIGGEVGTDEIVMRDGSRRRLQACLRQNNGFWNITVSTSVE